MLRSVIQIIKFPLWTVTTRSNRFVSLSTFPCPYFSEKPTFPAKWWDQSKAVFHQQIFRATSSDSRKILKQRIFWFLLIVTFLFVEGPGRKSCLHSSGVCSSSSSNTSPTGSPSRNSGAERARTQQSTPPLQPALKQTSTKKVVFWLCLFLLLVAIVIQ